MADSRTVYQTDSPYGADVMPTPFAGTAESPAVTNPASALSRQVQLTDETYPSDIVQGQRAARIAEGERTPATVLESIGAAAYNWDTTAILRRIQRPSFAGEQPVDLYEALQQLPFGQLSEGEHKFATDNIKGVESLQWVADQLRTSRAAQQASGDHMIAATAMAFGDPLWLALPPAFKVGGAATAAGRAGQRVASGAVAASTEAAAVNLREGPTETDEQMIRMLAAGAAGAVLLRNGKVVPKDPEFPAQKLHATTQTASKTVQGETPVPPKTHAEASTEADTALNTEAKQRGWASTLQFNMHKQLSGYGAVGKRVADLLLDNNGDLSLTSIEARHEAIASEGIMFRNGYEDMLRAEVAQRGFGTMRQITTPGQYYKAQREVESQVAKEMLRREQLSRQGRPITNESVPPAITAMADQLDKLTRHMDTQTKAAKVNGADGYKWYSGYMPRQWDAGRGEDILQRFKAQGLSDKQARARMNDLVSLALRNGSHMRKEVADLVADSVISRMFDRGYRNNTAAGLMDTGQLNWLEGRLRQIGASEDEINSTLARFRSDVDDAGKSAYLRHRLDLDYRATIQVGSERVAVTDLLDDRVSTIMDRYIKSTSTDVAFAESGMFSRADVENLRDELMKDTPMHQRAEAAELFDNIIAHLRGNAAGAQMGPKFRLMQAFNRSVSLAWSGLWQLTEYSTAMAEYGFLKTLRYGAQELPGFKAMTSPTGSDARTLNTVLADHSSQSLRIRPFIARYEDGFDMDMGNSLQLSAQTVQQMVPFANAMKYIHHHQARMVGNLILDRLEIAAKGDAKARQALAKYGIDQHVMDEVAKEIDKHGFKVDSWNSKTWAKTRPAFAKMMDAAVLQGRLGDMPAFAMFNQAGKFIFTYRSFVLTAHNKLLAGGIERNGMGAVALLMMYQFPLAMAAVAAQNSLQGKKPMNDKELASAAVGQMGGLGLFSEAFKVLSGSSNSLGNMPGLIGVDRLARTAGSIAQGDLPKATQNAMALLPVANANPIFNAMVQQTKEK